MPESFEANRRDLVENSFDAPWLREEARRAEVNTSAPAAAYSYMLDQAEIGMTCALRTGGAMVYRLVREFAPAHVQARLLPLFEARPSPGEAAPLLTATTGRS